MTTPIVSITSAFYNEEDCILDMVKSVFGQTFTDWELILLDDGSTDNSFKIAQSIDDIRVRVFTNGKNIGRSASLNRMTNLARGKYIARMDADDICCTTRIAKQVKLIESDPELDAVGTGMFFLDKNEEPIGHWLAPSSHAEICKMSSRSFGISHGTLLGKKSWFEQNPYDESLALAIDFNLFFRCYRNSVFSNVPEALYCYRLRQSFSLRQQWTARQGSVRFLFKHNISEGRFFKAFINVIEQYGKFAVTVLMFALGLRDQLMARRYDLLSEPEKKFYQEDISKIMNVELPLKD